MRPPLSGQLLGNRYRLGEELSAGGMGAVHRAVDTRMNRPVAVKLVLAELVTESRFAERFAREVQMAGALAHPHIVQITDVGEGPDGAPYLVMELLEGETLGAVFKREERLPIPRAATIACQILDGVGEAHRAGVLHRDLKPPNIFLVDAAGGADMVKILDFGIAKLMETEAYRRLTKTGQIVGTPAWMAPEQARGEVLDARSDLYAVGLLAYRAIAGRLPWRASSLAELMVAVQREAPTPLVGLVPEVDPELDATLLRALHKQPEGRFADAHAMREALARWTRGSTAPLVGSQADAVEATAVSPPVASAATIPATPVSPARSSAPVANEPAPSPVAAALPRPRKRLWLRAAVGLVALLVLLGLVTVGGVALWARTSSDSGASGSGTTNPLPPASAGVPSPPPTQPPPAATTATAAATCNDTCQYAHDGSCDDGRPGAPFRACAPGTDCSDCGPLEVVPSGTAAGACQDTCRYASDGECDDGRPGAVTSLCGPGTDCADCGPVGAALAAGAARAGPK